MKLYGHEFLQLCYHFQSEHLHLWDIQKLRPLERVRFTAEVDGTEDKSVTWSVSDPEGGSIDDNGLYQAPSEEGTYEVIARSNADGETRTSAFVLVGE